MPIAPVPALLPDRECFFKDVTTLVRALPGATPAPSHGFIEPALATSRSTVPAGGNFVHELKLDGYRLQAHVLGGCVTLYTRSGLDWTKRFATIAADVRRLPAGALILDGEIISADANGHPDFSALQEDLKRGRQDRFVYYAFDLLHLDGFDTRAVPLAERKRMLTFLLPDTRTKVSRVLYNEHFDDGVGLYGQANAMGLEGIVSKRADAPYRSGRGETWLKVKCHKFERFIIVGFSPEGSFGIANLRLARRARRELVYVGCVGTGWDRKTAAVIRRALAPLARSTCPLAKPINRADTIWIEPGYQADVAYTEITSDGMVRHPSFKGLVSSR
jgi:bifunctional non-homologous end joining protein LigD